MKQCEKTTQSPIHPLQTAAWAAFRTSMHVDIESLDGTFISFHHIPHTKWTVGYMPKGSMPTESFLHELKHVGKEKNAIFIQLEPNIQKNETKNTDVSAQLIPSHHPLFTKYTFVLDLTKSEEELLKAMHPKTRYNIRVAQKHGVTIQEDNSDSAFETYLKLEKETTDRQRFFAHNEHYQRMMWKHMHDAGIAHLWTATHEGETLAAWIVFVYDRIMYYPYGASSRNHREVMAPNLLLWELALWGKKHDITAFDLWGAMGPNPDPHDPWFGFHRFKEGYHPTFVEFIGSYDLVIHPVLYRLYCFLDTVRWFLLKMKAV